MTRAGDGQTQPSPKLDAEVLRYYELAPEAERLLSGVGKLELMRTQEIICRYLPEPPAVVLDVGGGPGIYTRWLAARGFETHLIEPVPGLVEQARQADRDSGDRSVASFQVGDARDLPWPDGGVDAVLLLGPLYHLPQSADRRHALSESHRVLRDGGMLFAAAISRTASALDGLARNLADDPEFLRIVEEDLESGCHINPTGRLDYFTTAYFHTPEELEMEVLAADLEVVGIFGVEGPGWLLHDLDERWADDARRETLLKIVRALETEPSVAGVSAHLLAVARAKRR